MLKFQRNFSGNQLQLMESTGYDCGAVARFILGDLVPVEDTIKEIVSYPIQELSASELKLLAMCNILLEHYTFPASEEE